MVSVRILDVIFVGQFIDPLQIFSIFRKKLMTMQPMLEEAVERGNVHLPLLDSYTHWYRVPPDHYKICFGECRLQEPCHEQVGRSFLHADSLILVPMSFPTTPQFQSVLWC